MCFTLLSKDSLFSHDISRGPGFMHYVVRIDAEEWIKMMTDLRLRVKVRSLNIQLFEAQCAQT